MKTAVIYYSLTGNTAWTAKKIAEKLGADCFSIAPIDAYPDKGAKMYFLCGKSSVFEEKPALQPCTFDAGQYDRLVFGSPVWASNFAPPLRTFIEEHREAAAKCRGIFVCNSGGNGEKPIRRLKTFAGLEGRMAQLILLDPKTKAKPENEDRICRFCEELGE